MPQLTVTISSVDLDELLAAIEYSGFARETDESTTAYMTRCIDMWVRSSVKQYRVEQAKLAVADPGVMVT